MTTRITEAEMAAVVKRILKRRPNQSATFAELRELVPKKVHLSKADRAKSLSRPSEEVWEQIIRNIKVHQREGFVAVQGGIRLQWRGNGNGHKAKPQQEAVEREHVEPPVGEGMEMVMA